MKRLVQAGTSWVSRRGLGEACGSQIVEFAVTLPLITVFVVGIFDFGSAFGLKQRMMNAVREGARVGANQPTADLSQTPPPSVEAITQVVVSSLAGAKVNDCGLAGAAPVASGTLTWTVTGTNCAAGNVVLTINRGYTLTVPATSPYTQTMTVAATQVTLTYPYKWQFGNVITLLVPTATYAGTTQLSVAATLQNMN